MNDFKRGEPHTFSYGHQHRVSHSGGSPQDGIYFIAGRSREAGGTAPPLPELQQQSIPLPQPQTKLPAGQNLRLEEAIKLHDEGIAGNKEAVLQAYQLLQNLHELEPSNPLITGYLGSITALLGRDTVDPLERMSKALEGLKILDQVVASSPDHLQLRILRGYVSCKLPEMYFHRNKTAVEDFTYLISRYEQDHTLVTENFYWQLLYDLGLAYKNIGKLSESEATWSKLLSQSTDPKFAALLRQEGFQAALALPVVAAIPSDEKKKLIEEGWEFYKRAKAGDRTATSQALNSFNAVLSADPGDNAAAAYYADCLSLQSRHSAEPGEMFSSAIKAMKLLDQAVSAEPDNPEIRLTRAGHSLRLPEAFFKRTATAISDLEYLIQRREKEESLLPQETFEQCLNDLGEAYQRLKMEKESRDCWRRIANTTTNLKRKEQAAKKLTLLDAPLRRPIPFVKELLFQEGLRLHDLAVAGNSKAAAAAYNLLEKVYEISPSDPLVQGYYASAMALAARESNDPGQMFGKTISALNLLKKAISRDWNNPRLHLLRGYLAFSLPESFFHMSNMAVKDLKFVKNAWENNSKLLSTAQYWQLCYDLGTAYENSGEPEAARKIWAKLQEECQDSQVLQLLDKKLKG